MANEARKVFPLVKDIVEAEGIGLDLGCGPFKITPACVGVDSGRYDGVIDMPALAFLEEQLDDWYNWIFSSHYLEHEPRASEVLRHCYRVLKPGGTLMLYVPDHNVYLDGNGKDPNAEHVNFFTAHSLHQMVYPIGFRVEECRQRTTCPPGHRFTGNGNTEDPRCAEWEYSIFLRAVK
jgi:SAM-dependent methyltransferase